ncbi:MULTISPECIES: cytochrome o ubiquinol oxidase subunit IV [Paraburkholderia]|uniref:Cytochrome bo(3) ubiquinol oxidase subunit 4 n=1 Tax=Paraburkholderia tropica TaxID=92647 RepID=A0A1A5WZB7_9BURK|nr:MULTISPECIES: cytochrome o ubiquinol oxidase subunit IV [Paraburkholderia]MBB2981830.1 cytochrome o ubiquinol oxidase operon protein cyoD [Paraburkholderia tropica]MBB3002907.1 cytochrome o ubiquinol oxidase operon protein cyoD [Paraburkholderia tropica]MBB6320506.1 cytochrome o ubiquinol oxidase operon protein cyoD [Paraburkholderia tropica]MDE1138364.1 cytochrome o ubiquinol oxidase subunit IV [Paraburkholderia tropica]OBR46419.1 cytochrome o ubiquinol oxidase subunit IV [Paraburkholderia
MSAHSIHEEESHGSVASYVAGFVLAVVLTAASFWLVLHGGFPRETALLGLAVLAVVQIVVHLVFFLHMNTSSGQRWNVTAFGFTVLTVLIVVVGTLWVMHNVSMNMMSR